jgi:hypothetical protein
MKLKKKIKFHKTNQALPLPRDQHWLRYRLHLMICEKKNDNNIDYYLFSSVLESYTTYLLRRTVTEAPSRLAMVPSVSKEASISVRDKPCKNPSSPTPIS